MLVLYTARFTNRNAGYRTVGNSFNIIYVLIYSFKTNDTHSYESPSFVNLFEGNLQYILALKVSLLWIVLRCFIILFSVPDLRLKYNNPFILQHSIFTETHWSRWLFNLNLNVLKFILRSSTRVETIMIYIHILNTVSLIQKYIV